MKKVKTVKSARKSDGRQEKSGKSKESLVKRVDGSRPKLMRDQGNMSEASNNVEAIEVLEEVAQSSGKDKIPLIKSQKTGRKSHKCKECEKEFGNKWDLKIHLSTVHRKEKDHQCTQCEKKFSKKSILQKHLATVHRKEKAHQCTQCEEKFGLKSNLQQHLATVHRDYFKHKKIAHGGK